MADVNVYRLGTISTEEVIPFTIEFANIAVQAGNVVAKAVRIDKDVSGDVGVDISSLCQVELNKILVTNIWLPSETAVAGNYKIKIVLSDSIDLIVKEETNVYIRVV